MKTVITTLAVLTALYVGARPAGAAEREPQPIPAAEAIDDDNVQPSPEQRSALDQAAKVAQEALKRAEKAGAYAQEQVLRETQQAMKQVKQAMERVRSKMAQGDLAEPEEPGADDGEPVTQFYNVIGNGEGMPGQQNRLIIRTSEADPASMSDIREDLAVMSRIVNKAVDRAVGRPARDSAMGIVLSALPGSRRPDSLYLEGYGTVFFVNVKFPLVPSAPKDEDKAAQTPDSTWEQTKRELSVERPAVPRLWEVPSGDVPAEYKSEPVDALKKELLESLKNATNLRHLKPEESVTIAVIGHRSAALGRLKRVGTMNKSGTRKAELHAVDVSGRAPDRESMLTIRVKKADVDAFAKGEIDSAEFAKHASVLTY
jgi:hypothetical protein